jgi:membrane protease YdiL (CAAX protease family)
MTRRDALFIALCVVLAAVATGVVTRYFDSAFPEASIEFRYDRGTSRVIAERLLTRLGIDTRDHKRATVFDSDGQARVFLERTLGLERANDVMRRDVRLWSWHHRWFRPLVEDEVSVDVAPTGEIVRFQRKIPEGRALPDGNLELARGFLGSVGVDLNDLQLVAQSERKLPKRTQRIFTWESKTIRPGGAPYRHTVTLDGNLVSGYSQRVKVPDAWLRGYAELRSKNRAAGSIDVILMIATMLATLVVFIVRLRRGDLHLNFLLVLGGISIVLVTGVALNELPRSLAYYDTTTSYPAFIAREIFFSVMQSLGTAMLLIVVCGAGEVLYRERLPHQLAIPKLWTRKALASKRVFLGLILGYALVPMFMAYQVVFYLSARRVGAWSPAEVPYDDMLNTALPWVAVLFAGFFPAFSEEFLSRAFSIPFLQKLIRSRIAAIVLAGFIWGFGHSMYPNQPWWIRGVEVGLVGVVAGLLMDRFGLLPLLVWHYTIDAIYTAALLFRSGNNYYVLSAGIASLIFAVPLVAAIAMVIRNRGFIPDDDLTNATLPVSPPPPPVPREVTVTLPPAIPVTRSRVIACAVAIAAAIAMVAMREPSAQDAIDYRITKEQAKEIAKRHVGTTAAHIIATPFEGFRYWDERSSREDGGSPGGFDGVAATYLVRNGMNTPRLIDVMRNELEAGTYVVRFFTPGQKEETFVEVDPRDGAVIGYHKYQDEAARGAQLSKEQALALATREFPRYGETAAAWELKEPLTYAQPNRRDWLFHFQEKKPLAGEAYRRVAIRVAGAEVTQFNKTIRVPESVRREADEQTLLNVSLSALNLIGMIAVLGLIIAGLVLATREHGLPWRRAAKWAVVLSLIPALNFAARYESMLFSYSTAAAWETFRIELVTSFIRTVGLQAGLIFLAVAGTESLMPHAIAIFSREGRARFGRAAAISALTALALLVIAMSAMRLADRFAPTVDLQVPLEVATPLPALTEGLQAIVTALVFAGAVALYTHAVKKHTAIITTVGIFCISLQASVKPAEAPLMLVSAAVVAAVAWIIGRYILGDNALAWPVAAFVGSIANAAAVLLRNSRNDLLVHGVVLVLIAVAAMAWVSMRREETLA